MPEKAYKLSELTTEEAKHKAVEWFLRTQSWYFEYRPWIDDELTDMFKMELEQLGLPVDNVHYSLGNCQGDGVNFVGRVDIQKYMEAHDLRAWGPLEEFMSISMRYVLRGREDYILHMNEKELVNLVKSGLSALIRPADKAKKCRACSKLYRR